MQVQIIVKKSDVEKFLEHMFKDMKVLMLKGKEQGSIISFEVTYK